ncbi:MAG: gamma-glutamyltransferase [Cellvibrionaceae bacterium]
MKLFHYFVLFALSSVVSIYAPIVGADSAQKSSKNTPTQKILAGTVFESSQGAVATVHPLATGAAAKQLKNGGNAIDAAIAAALTLGIVDSYNSGIGGGLFALVHWADGRVEAIDGREMAPSKAHRDLYIRDGKAVAELSRTGALAIGIPGSVAAFDYLSLNGGNIPIATLYQQAAELAAQGFPVSVEYANRLKRHANNLGRFKATRAIFLDSANEAQPWAAGHRLIQADLANTYQHLAKQGSDYFYKGQFAQRLAAWMQSNGGLITAEDMANYQLKIREPVKSQFYGHTIYGFPPPSSGGIHVAQLLNMVEELALDKKDQNTRNHLLAESMKLAFADRAYWLGDPDFVKVPKSLIDQAYTTSLAQSINDKKVSVVTGHSVPPNAKDDWFDKHTTHIAVADKQGNWVAITTTLNTSFGSKVVVPGTGVLMNNQMDDFSAQPGVPNTYGLVGSESNSIQPGKRPLSSMSPTLVLKQGKPVMTLGAAGGPMIITQVTQGIINHLLLNQNLYTSLASPRIHQQWLPDVLFHDKKLPQEQQQALTDKGHKLKQLRFEGSTNGISIRSGSFKAVSEPRLVERNEK